MSRKLILLFAVACGFSAANIYFAHPLLDAIGRDFSLDAAAEGLVVSATQIGYGLGLLLIVPLGDLLDRRRLVAAQAVLSALALAVVGLSTTLPILLVGMGVVGILAVMIQVLVAFSASLATPARRGGTVGSVTSGVVVGILLARFVAGTIADLGGWRLVYLGAAGAMLILAALLYLVCPREDKRSRSMSYTALMLSTLSLIRQEPTLRVRGTLAFLIFAAFNILWAPLVLPLSAPPLLLSHSEVGLFGLAGAAGAVAAARAGQFSDRGRGQLTTGVALGVMLVSWLPIALLHQSLIALAVGLVLLDLAIQATHVTNQNMIFGIRPEARSRLVAGYMIFYSFGSAIGAAGSTATYAYAGWTGVCIFGAAVSAIALAFWGSTLRLSRSPHKQGLSTSPR